MMFSRVLYYIMNFEIIALDKYVAFAVFAITQLLCTVAGSGEFLDYFSEISLTSQ